MKLLDSKIANRFRLPLFQVIINLILVIPLLPFILLIVFYFWLYYKILDKFNLDKSKGKLKIVNENMECLVALEEFELMQKEIWISKYARLFYTIHENPSGPRRGVYIRDNFRGVKYKNITNFYSVYSKLNNNLR